MPDTRQRLNWLDRAVFFAAIVVTIAAGFVGWRVARVDDRLTVNRAVGCQTQLALTSSTVPACAGIGPLANRR